MNTTKINTTKIGFSRREGNNYIVEVDVKFSVNNGIQNEYTLKNIANRLMAYYKKNKANDVRLVSCWTSSNEVYNGLLDEKYFAGWLEIRFNKEIKTRTLTRQLNALTKLAEKIIKEESEALNRYLELNDYYSDLKNGVEAVEEKDMSITDNYTKEDIIVLAQNENFLPSSGDFYKGGINSLDGRYVKTWLEKRGFEVIKNYDTGRNGIAITKCGIQVSTNGRCSMIIGGDKPPKKKKDNNFTFSPQCTAIDVNSSKSANMVLDMIQPQTRILDYGCGTGRNIRHIRNNNKNVIIDGTDIVEQLEKEKNKHDMIRDERTLIEETEKLPNDYYDIVLNSHVLNVIEDDSIKKIVVSDIYDKLLEGGQAIIEVRTKSDVEGAKTKEKYGDGWKIKKGSSFTYQEALSKEKMQTLVTDVGFKIQEHIYDSNKHIIKLAK